MSKNPISISHHQFVSHLYSLTGPQENLPTLLVQLLNNKEDIIRQKLEGSLSFSKEDLITLESHFQNSALFNQKIA